MINDVVAKEELRRSTMRLARPDRANAPLSIAVMKEQLRILAGARPMSPQGFERVQGLRRLVYDSEDYREGIRAFKEKRKPVFRGKMNPHARKTLACSLPPQGAQSAPRGGPSGPTDAPCRRLRTLAVRVPRTAQKMLGDVCDAHNGGRAARGAGRVRSLRSRRATR